MLLQRRRLRVYVPDSPPPRRRRRRRHHCVAVPLSFHSHPADFFFYYLLCFFMWIKFYTVALLHPNSKQCFLIIKYKIR